MFKTERKDVIDQRFVLDIDQYQRAGSMEIQICSTLKSNASFSNQIAKCARPRSAATAELGTASMKRELYSIHVVHSKLFSGFWPNIQHVKRRISKYYLSLNRNEISSSNVKINDYIIDSNNDLQDHLSSNSSKALEWDELVIPAGKILGDSVELFHKDKLDI